MREVYRDKRGRFVSRRSLWQGPLHPTDPRHPINVEREKARVQMWAKAIAAEVTKESYFAKFMGL